jgi:hypothetical protein
MLIGASVLTTYQHHFVDLPTGFALGWLCVWLWPLAPGVAAPVPAWRTSTDPARHRVAALYALAAVGCGAVALAGGAWLWLLWPALSLALVALAYAGVGVAAFQKSADGRLSLAARWLFAPYRAGAWLNSRLWTWRHPAPVPLGDGVWLGRVPPPADVGGMPFAGNVDLTAEFSLHHASAHYASVPMLDLATPTPTALADAAAAIERLRARGPVLVCCALGYSRSACAAAAWLLASGRAKAVDDALVRVRAARAQIVLRPRHLDALRALPAPAPG